MEPEIPNELQGDAYAAGPQTIHCGTPDLYTLASKTLVKITHKNLKQATISTSFNNLNGFVRLIWGRGGYYYPDVWGKRRQLLKGGGLRDDNESKHLHSMMCFTWGN